MSFVALRAKICVTSYNKPNLRYVKCNTSNRLYIVKRTRVHAVCGSRVQCKIFEFYLFEV